MNDPQLPRGSFSVTAQFQGPGLGYFIVRVRRGPDLSAGECAGVVERVGTGEKREFRTSAELIRALTEWSP
jgi:hypothetical protein